MKNNIKLKTIPTFRTEDEEAKFWNNHDSTEYVDCSKAVQADFPNLKPSTKSITLRLPVNLLNSIKTLANKRDVPYQSMMKILLAQKVKEEQKIVVSR